MHRLVAAALLFFCLAPGIALAQTEPPRLNSSASIDLAGPAAIKLAGLAPNERVDVHVLRRLQRWAPQADGAWGPSQVVLHAWGRVAADRNGRINMRRAIPEMGTYARPSAAALLWSGFPQGAPELGATQDVSALGATLNSDQALLVVTRAGEVILTQPLKLETVPGIETMVVRAPGLVGVFAAPPGPKPAPTIIALHGSEGGNLDVAADQARRFARWGFATLAVTYFTTSWSPPIEGVTTAHDRIPLEMIDRARAWLAERPEVDRKRIGLWGVSKGAEFAALAATRFQWVKAVVPCVGSDVVWEGYGRQGAPVQGYSSWSAAGAPVQYVPLIPFVANDPRWRTNTDRYLASRAAMPREVLAAARIPIERARARFLFIGSDRDEVWASGAMSREMFHSRQATRPGDDQLLVFALAGHQICGDGTWPVRLYGQQAQDPTLKNLNAEGEAAEDAWKATIWFFKGAL
jgi:dienelactone hydrolase